MLLDQAKPFHADEATERPDEQPVQAKISLAGHIVLQNRDTSPISSFLSSAVLVTGG